MITIETEYEPDSNPELISAQTVIKVAGHVVWADDWCTGAPGAVAGQLQVQYEAATVRLADALRGLLDGSTR